MDRLSDPWLYRQGETTLWWRAVFEEPTPPHPDAWAYALLMTRLSPERAAAVFGVSSRTLSRYRSGRTRIPTAAWKLALILAGWCLWEGWENWRCVQKALYSPNDPYSGWTPEALTSQTYSRVPAQNRNDLKAL